MVLGLYRGSARVGQLTPSGARRPAGLRPLPSAAASPDDDATYNADSFVRVAEAQDGAPFRAQVRRAVLEWY